MSAPNPRPDIEAILRELFEAHGTKSSEKLGEGNQPLYMFHEGARLALEQVAQRLGITLE